MSSPLRQRSNANSTVYTLKRGELEVFDCTFIDRLDSLRKMGMIGDLLEEIRSTAYDDNFGGILFSVRFLVDRPIYMTSVGFWGPSNGETCRYDVKVIVSQYASSYPTESPNDCILDRVSTSIEARPKDIFEIPFTEPVWIRAGKWIQIRFQLDGPDTFISSNSSLLSSYSCQDSGVNFEFHMSSHQLPRINYRLA